MKSTLSRTMVVAGLLTVLGIAGAARSAGAQPFNIWLTMNGDSANGWVDVGNSAALNPTGAFTFEGWVAISNHSSGEDCRTIAGRNYQAAWWLGLCTVGGKPTLRSYLKGGGSSRNGGIIPPGVWTHVAVVFNGTQRLHYINGELAASFAETGPLTTSTAHVQFGSDVSWAHTPNGAFNEFRLWNVARSQDQIRATINVPITSAQPGLVAVWRDGLHDVFGSYNGVQGGSGTGFLSFPAGPTGCGASTSSALCLQGRFSITTKWRTNPTPGTPTDGNGSVVVAGPNSGIFWFFSVDNWEVMVKAINGCGLNSRYWLFSAATTNVFYRMEVFDYKGLENKIYFNYPGPPAPAVTDVSAFDTCP